MQAVSPLRDTARARDGLAASTPCADYDVDLRVLAAVRGWRGAVGADGSVFANSAWLLRPEASDRLSHVALTLSLPEGTHAVVPWPRRDDGYETDRSLLAWEGYLMLSARAPTVVQTALARFEVASLHAGSMDPTAWLSAAANAVFPLAAQRGIGTVQVILDSRRAPAGSPPGFGLSSRGGGRSLLFVVGRDASREDLVGEWIAVHEMVHLLLPVTRDEDAWLGEGIATYYQEVLRARAGMISAEQAWENLRRGFAAGARESTGDTLAEVARRGGDYTRLYWSGAALALRMDAALRRRASSLDEVVRAWRLCCADEPRTWSAMELLARADEALRPPVLVAEARQALEGRSPPDVSEVLAAQGSLRDEIMAPPRAAALAP